MKVDEWKSRYEQDKFYFRPHLHKDSHEDDIEQNSEIESEMNDEGKEESVYLTRHRASSDGKTLLFVLQSAWQRRLLQRYGHVCLLDATYKTTKYALPLFFVAVKTNVDYQTVVGILGIFSQISANRKLWLSRVPLKVRLIYSFFLSNNV